MYVPHSKNFNIKNIYTTIIRDLEYTFFCLIFIFFYLYIPTHYESKMQTGIIKSDLYLIWIIGTFCWIKSDFSLLQRHILLLFGIILLATLSSLLHVNNDLNSFKILITLFFSFGIYCYILTREFNLKYLFVLITPSLLYQLFQGYSQFISHNYDSLMIKGQFFNSGYFANWLSVCAVLIFSSIVNKESLFSKKIVDFTFIIIFISTFCLIILTQARSAILGLLIGCIYILLVKHKWYFRYKRKLIFFLIILFFTLSILFINIKTNSWLGRITIYKVSLSLIKENLLFGVGANRFQVYYNIYQTQYFKNQNLPIHIEILANNTFEAFNFVLQWLSEYGIVSLILGFAYFIFIFKFNLLPLVLKKEYLWMNNHIASLLCIISSAFFSNTFHCSVIFILFVILLASVYKLNINKRDSFVRTIYCTKVIKVLFIFLSCFFLFFAHLQYNAEKKWAKASNLARFGIINKAMPLYMEAYIDLKNDGRFLYNFGTECFQAKSYNRSLNLLKRASIYHTSINQYLYLGHVYLALSNFKSAEENFLNAHYLAPGNLIPKYQLINLYNSSKNDSLTKIWINKTLNYPVKIKSEITDLILDEIKLIELKIIKNQSTKIN